jgi:hypothetical protein
MNASLMLTPHNLLPQPVDVQRASLRVPLNANGSLASGAAKRSSAPFHRNALAAISIRWVRHYGKQTCCNRCCDEARNQGDDEDQSAAADVHVSRTPQPIPIALPIATKSAKLQSPSSIAGSADSRHGLRGDRVASRLPEWSGVQF